MEREELYKKLNEIFIDVLDLDESPNLSDATTADAIEDWDSLSNVQLVVAIEKQFGIKFTSYEITSWIDVGEMVDCILKKMS